jgi:hypothetical protein
MTLAVGQRAGNDYKMKDGNYPFLVKVEQEVFELPV